MALTNQKADMETEKFFFSNDTACLTFKVDSDKSFLPFPLNQNLYWRLLMSAALVAILVQGYKKRLLIAAYLKSPEVKLNPPTILFGLDQVNGIFLALSILFRIAFNLLPESLSDLAYPNVCDFVELFSGLYISGTIGWRCNMAIVKLLYVKGSQWLKNNTKANKILAVQVTLVIFTMTAVSIVMVICDKDSYIKRSCYHKTAVDLEIMYGLKVSYLFVK